MLNTCCIVALGNWILALAQRQLQLSGDGEQDISHGTDADAAVFGSDGAQRHRQKREAGDLITSPWQWPR